MSFESTIAIHDAERRRDGATRLSDSAVDGLYRRHNRALRGLARRRVGWEDADDVVQEAYLRLLEMESVGRVADMRGYLYRVASNVAIDFLRKRKTRSACLVDDPKPGEARSGDSLLPCAAEEAILVRRIEASLAELPSGCSETFLLSRLYGMTCPEIAERLGISLRTVNRHISRTIEHLQATLEGEGAAPASRGRASGAEAGGARAPALADAE